MLCEGVSILTKNANRGCIVFRGSPVAAPLALGAAFLGGDRPQCMRRFESGEADVRVFRSSRILRVELDFGRRFGCSSSYPALQRKPFGLSGKKKPERLDLTCEKGGGLVGLQFAVLESRGGGRGSGNPPAASARQPSSCAAFGPHRGRHFRRTEFSLRARRAFEVLIASFDCCG